MNERLALVETLIARRLRKTATGGDGGRWVGSYPSFRRGFNGLAAPVAQHLDEDAFSGALFMFRGRRGSDGIVLLAVGWRSVGATVIEVGYIAVQAGRQRHSHFNKDMRLEAAIYAVSGSARSWCSRGPSSSESRRRYRVLWRVRRPSDWQCLLSLSWVPG